MSARTRMIATIAGVLVVLLIGYFFLISPRKSELADVQASVVAAKSETQSLQAQLAHRQDLQEREPQLRADLQEIRSLVPQKDEVANFIFQVKDAADKAGVSFLQITPELPQPPAEGALLAEVGVALRANGGYFAIQDFIRRLYALDRAVRIDNLALTASTAVDGARGTTLELAAGARIFFELPVAAAVVPAGAAPAPAPTSTESPTPSPGT